MRLRERTNDESTLNLPDPPVGNGPNMEQLRQSGLGFAAAAAAAIERALSTNSEEFLKANRQEGGE